MSFFDSYALIELAHGNQAVLALAGESFRTTLMNLYEMYFILAQKQHESLAEQSFEVLLPACTDIKAEDIKVAAKFRLQHAKRGFSYVDALGYTMALRLGLPFVTGDDDFAGFPQVTFIK